MWKGKMVPDVYLKNNSHYLKDEAHYDLRINLIRCASQNLALSIPIKNPQVSNPSRKVTKPLPLLLGQGYSSAARTAHGDAGGTEASRAQDWEPSWWGSARHRCCPPASSTMPMDSRGYTPSCWRHDCGLTTKTMFQPSNPTQMFLPSITMS